MPNIIRGIKYLIVISKNIQRKKFNVDLHATNGTGDHAFLVVGKKFGVDVQTAHKEAKRLADLYDASIEDRTGS